MATPQEIRAYLDADPDALGLAALVAAGNHSGVTAAVNAPFGDPVPGVIDIASVEALLHTQTHASGLPAWVVIEDYAANAEGDAGLRAACRMVVAVVQSKYQTIDFGLTAVQTILAGLVAGTLLTQAQADALAALSHTRPSSAVRRLGAAVTLNEVSKALALEA